MVDFVENFVEAGALKKLLSAQPESTQVVSIDIKSEPNSFVFESERNRMLSRLMNLSVSPTIPHQMRWPWSNCGSRSATLIVTLGWEMDLPVRTFWKESYTLKVLALDL